MYFIAKCYWCEEKVVMTDTTVPYYLIFCDGHKK